MTNLIGQLTRWRLIERLIRLAWGAGRWVAVVGAVLAVACAVDWLADRYLGSESWRKFRTSTWVFAPRAAAAETWSPDAIMDETPKWLRYGMTLGQLALAGTLAYVLMIRPWRRTPPVDELAGTAEKAIPAFGHRLVTAVQLNRPAARTQGMSTALIAEVTREAGELASRHNLLKLVDYSRVVLAAAVALPILVGWGAFAAVKPELTGVLLKRQALMNVEIPRTIFLKNVSQEVWPTGDEVVVRYHVTGEYDPAVTGRLRIEPEGQPEEYYDLQYEKDVDGGGAFYSTKLPASSRDFTFTARLGNGRSRERGQVTFEERPHAKEIDAWQVLPAFLGTRKDGSRFERPSDSATRGEIIDVLPGSEIQIQVLFTKPVQSATLVRIERGDGISEKLLPGLAPQVQNDARTEAAWRFPTTERTIGYRLDLVDDRGFKNGVPIRRTIRMWEDRAPTVAFMPESTRHPDPTNEFEGNLKHKVDYEWGDKMPLPEGGRIMVIYHAHSDLGVSRANIRYRVIPRGIDFGRLPPDVRDIQHPAQDPENKVFGRLPLKPVTADLKTVGNYVLDLGLFERSWQGLSRADRFRVNVEFYSLPSPRPDEVPPGIDAGGRYMFEVDGLVKYVPDAEGKLQPAKLEIGDTVELFVEAFDKNPYRDRPLPGYTKEARRKIVVSGEEAYAATKMRDEQNKRLQDKLRDLARDQANVFKPLKDDEEPKEPKK